MTGVTAQAHQAFLRAYAAIPKQHRAWLEADDIELFSYHGWGVVPNQPQLEMWDATLTSPPGTAIIARYANRAGKTTGDLILETWWAWKKLRYQAAELDQWFNYEYRVLHAAPLNNLAAKTHALAAALVAGTAEAQQDPFTLRQRPAILAPFFSATKVIDAHGVDLPIIRCANGSRIELYSTQGGAGRMESETWWLLVWDEFARQQPFEDIPLLFDQTFLPRAADHDSPILLTSTATVDSEPAYMALEDMAKEKPAYFRFLTAGRSGNFAMTRSSTERQVQMSTDKEVADRSVGGTFGEGSSEVFPEFAIANTFTTDLPGHTSISEPITIGARTASIETWVDEGRFAVFSSYDHALVTDPNVVQTWLVPWPPSRVSPFDPIRGLHNRVEKSRRSLTPSDQQRFIRDEIRAYNPELVIIDGAAEGGVGVYRQARHDGLQVRDCSFSARFAKYVSNKDFALYALQRLLGWGLPVEPGEGNDYDLVTDWPLPDGPFGILRLPEDWRRLKMQFRRYKRADEKLRQDELMAAAMLAWHLFPLLEQAGVMKPRPFIYTAPR